MPGWSPQVLQPRASLLRGGKHAEGLGLGASILQGSVTHWTGPTASGTDCVPSCWGECNFETRQLHPCCLTDTGTNTQSAHIGGCAKHHAG